MFKRIVLLTLVLLLHTTFFTSLNTAAITDYDLSGNPENHIKIETSESNYESNLTKAADLFAFYYPWYGTPTVSGYWFHWIDATHNPNNFLDSRRDIPAKHYPLLDVYDSNDPSLIEKHIEIARMANIDGFVVSWWGIGSFEDNALLRIKNVSEQMGFKFTIYYESTASASNTLNDILYLLNNYANSSSWYRIDNRPVIFVYSRARDQLYPQAWKIYGSDAHWSVFEDIRDPPRDGIFVIHPYKDGIGYVESYTINLPPNETYSLEVAISDMRNDCPPYSDVGFRIKIKNETVGNWEILHDLIVNFNDGWLDLSYDISSYAGDSVLIRVESYPGGISRWCSEWAAVDYFFIKNSKGEIINQGPYFDDEWKAVVNSLNESGYNPYLIMDFGGHEDKVEYFADYFLDFADGIHTYNPSRYPMSNISEFYNRASNAAHAKNKTFIATVMPGYDDTEIRSPGYVVDRQNGSYYRSFWLAAKSALPDYYIITSFNEWHEGTEIEPSLEYQYSYINLTKVMSTAWTVDDDGPADFHTIQEAINAVNPGGTIFVFSGTYYEHVVVNKTVSLIGENRDTTIIDGNGTGTVVYITASNVSISQFMIQNGWLGIDLYPSSDENNISDNKIINNSVVGFYLNHSQGNTLRDNNMTDNKYNFAVIGDSISEFIHDIDTSNTVNGRPIYYLINRNNLTIEPSTFPGAGFLGLVGSTNITVRNLSLTNNFHGLVLAYTNKTIIKNVNATNNYIGISFWFSSDNTINNNEILRNHFGVYLLYSGGNKIYHNNFIDNIIQASVSESFNNFWDNGIIGNYWSDYTGTDADGDGIGDTPYVIDENNTDRYPFMNPFRVQLSYPRTLSIYQIRLEANEYFLNGSYLIVEFYTYSNLYQGNVTVWSGTTPAYVPLSVNVSHPLNWPIEIVTVVLTDNIGNVILTLTTFVLHRSHLMERLAKLDEDWLYASSAKRSLIFMEIVDIDAQWPYAPL